jgi:hypothetical protein
LAALLDTGGIKNTTDNMITNTRKVLHTSTAEYHDGVFLEVMALTRNISGDFHTISQTDTGNLAKSGVRLLRSSSLNQETYPALKRSRVEYWFILKGVEAAGHSDRLGLLHYLLAISFR